MICLKNEWWKMRDIFNVDLRSCSKWLDHRGLLQSWWFYEQIFYNRSCFGKVLSDIGDLPRRVTRGGAMSPLPFFRNWKKCPSFGQKCPDSGYLWVKFSFKMQFLRVSKKKPDIFPCGAKFFLVLYMIVYPSAQIPRKLPCS